MNNKPFYKKPSFYLGAVALLFTVIALSLYVGNCASEFNGGKPSPAVTAWEVVALVLLAVSVACDVAEYFVSKDGLLSEIFKYTRFLKYIAFIALIVTFFMQILDEYSLLGTILYPIVSGVKAGDPVAPALIANYFASIAFVLVAVVVSICSALFQKADTYRTEILIENVQEDK